MTRVGVRKLKDKLSGYLSRAKRGEKIVVTDRGKPVAMLTAVEQPPSPPTLDDILNRLEAEGHLRRGRGRLGFNEPVPSTGKPASQIIIEERE